MALDATWWATGFAAVRFDQDWSSAAAVNNILTAPWNMYDFKNVASLAGISKYNAGAQNKDFGFWYAVKDSDASVIKVLDYYWHFCDDAVLDPNLDSKLGKKIAAGGNNGYNAPASYFGAPPSSATVVAKVWWDTAGSANYSVHHYQPHYWIGNPAEVIGAVLRHVGLASAFIGTALWSDAETAQAAMATEPIVLYRRDIGEKVSESIKRIARHCNDILCVNMAGQIALVSRSSPPAGPTLLTPATTVGPTAWRYERKYLCNKADVSHGQWNYEQPQSTGSYPDGTWNVISVWEPNAESDTDGLLTSTYADATSQTKHGVSVLDNMQHRILEDGAYVQRPAYHLPYIYDEDCKDAVMARMAAVDSTLRRELVVREDFRGLDYDIGYEVTNVAVTSDGDTIAAATCIRKRIDFRNMQVTSWLLEEV